MDTVGMVHVWGRLVAQEGNLLDHLDRVIESVVPFWRARLRLDWQLSVFEFHFLLRCRSIGWLCWLLLGLRDAARI